MVTAHSADTKAQLHALAIVEDEEDEDDDEEESLIARRPANHHHRRLSDHDDASTTTMAVYTCRCLSVIAIITTILNISFMIFGWSQQQQQRQQHKQVVKVPSSRKSGSLDYACPSDIDKSENDKADAFAFYNITNDRRKKDVSNFRSWKFDGWSQTYAARKRFLRDWKVEAFVPNLQSGQSIYESACGEGLNLALTLEILAEYNISNLRVFGNEYLAESVTVANELFERIPIGGSSKGRLCHGDSTSLDFVSSDSFDLVFTGYIDPIMDPLNLFHKYAFAGGVDEMKHSNSEWCNSSIWSEKELARLSQEKQQEWYGAWIAEMCRITKPGHVIVVESLALPICEAKHDWGGVSMEWIHDMAVNNAFGWDVDPDSIMSLPQPGRSEQRSNFLMRKKKR